MWNKTEETEIASHKKRREAPASGWHRPGTVLRFSRGVRCFEGTPHKDNVGEVNVIKRTRRTPILHVAHTFYSYHTVFFHQSRDIMDTLLHTC